jgi:hypothetical protein
MYVALGIIVGVPALGWLVWAIADTIDAAKRR